MNRTKLFPLVAFLSITAPATQVFAEDSYRDGAPVAISTMSRAEVLALAAPAPTERDGAPTAFSSQARSEVLADLEVWRSSGLAAMERGEASDTSSTRYQMALARYHALRDSPAFADQVARLARQRGETMLLAQQH